ncbi:hypothetical protein [Methanobrevibacter sp.]|uniref:hypothetical protein n=1 Tax=Methanobrevibacter sp. TaxID=66852 RepID=UPI00388EE7AB
MDVYETIKNIRAKCDIYVAPDLVATIIDENNYMGSNTISEIKGYGITEEDSYEDKFMKILKDENIFINCGMLAFIPMINECDIFSVVDDTIKITQEEYDENAKENEVYFGILIEKNSSNHRIGMIDLCNCKLESGFREIKKSDDGLYKKLAEIIDEMIIS